MINKIPRKITQKSIKAIDTWLLHSSHRLMLIDMCLKFHEYNLLSGFQVIERPWLLLTDGQTTDRQRDGRTDARGKTISLHTLKEKI